MLEKEIGWNFDNTYAKLPSYMLTKINPTPVKNPVTVIFNHSLSKEIDLNFSNINEKDIASIFSGNYLPKGSISISQAYAGHQFGYFTILGDGRAHMIGEHLTKNKKRFDIQFKGSGQTPYSRSADGRAALGPMLREYLISEGMHSLGIPTTRSLAVIKTGEDVIRDKNLKGAILTRRASSHIRVGTFQYALVAKGENNLKRLFDYTINRHYPNIKKSNSPPIELLKTVMEKQIMLICNWMRIGFIHGVMNTDNMTISGETIDYGPCAFMDVYDPSTKFSSIDVNGRYAYFNQPKIASWNLERFAECLIPLIHEDSETAIKIAREVLIEFPKKYKKEWLNMMRKKIGLLEEDSKDEELIIELLTWMHKNKADFTNTFCYLMNKLKIQDNLYKTKEFLAWKQKWEKRRNRDVNRHEESNSLMIKSNPIIIPKNHLVEESLDLAVNENDMSKIVKLLKVIKNPEKYESNISSYQKNPLPENKYVTFCGT